MLLTWICSYLKSVVRYKYLILDTYHPDSVFNWSRMWGSMVISRSQKRSASKKVWEALLRSIVHLGCFSRLARDSSDTFSKYNFSSLLSKHMCSTYSVVILISVFQVHIEEFWWVLQPNRHSDMQQRWECDHGHHCSCSGVQSLPSEVRDDKLHVSRKDNTLPVSCEMLSPIHTAGTLTFQSRDCQNPSQLQH